MKDRNNRRHVLIIQHARHEHPAIILRALETQGIASTVLRVFENPKIPPLNEISGLICLGGPMHANDQETHPWIKDEIELLRKSTDAGLPVVGICLGAQLLAIALGGKVEKNLGWEIGWHPLSLSLEGLRDPVLSGVGSTPTVYQWHEDTFHLPKEAVLLAASERCPRQAFRWGDRAYGFQFHPEADHQLVEEWLSTDDIEHEIESLRSIAFDNSVHPRQQHRSDAYQHEINSLIITTSFSSLFRQREFVRGSPMIVSKIQEANSAANRRLLLFRFVYECPRRSPAELTGTIYRFLENGAHRFVIIQSSDGLLWPLRIDDILLFEEA